MGAMKLKEAAKVLGQPYSTLREWAVSGMIPAFRRMEKGTWYVYVDQVNEALRKRAA